MDDYKKLCEELEKTYMTYALTGNKESHIAKLLLRAASTISGLSTENERLNKQIDIAEHELMRRDDNIGYWTEDSIAFTDYDGVARSGVYGYKCSQCGGFCVGESKYCPNCGARMNIK